MAAGAEQQLSLVADLGLQGDLFAAAPAALPSSDQAPGEANRSGDEAPLDDAQLEADATARPRRRRPARAAGGLDLATGDGNGNGGELSGLDTEPIGSTSAATPDGSCAAAAAPADAEDLPDHDLPRWHHHSLVDPARLTPVLRHYVELKAAHPERVLLYRLGDFFECFFEDAITLSRLLELTLTGKEAGKAIGRVPMAGLPHHAAERHCSELVRRGLSVALCDQLETTPAKGALLKREITRVLTPGTVLDEGMLSARRNNWLAAVVREGNHWGLAVADVSTGEFRLTERQGTDLLHQELLQQDAAEVLWSGEPEPAWCPDGLLLTSQPRTPFAAPEARARLLARFRLASLDGLGLAEAPLALRAAGGLLAYLEGTETGRLVPLDMPRLWHTGDQLVLDAQTRRNLELTRTQLGGSLQGSLLWALDRSMTAMGGRCLRRWIEAPLVDRAAISARQDGVGELVASRSLRLSVRRLLRPMGDLERLAGRAGAGTASARDLVALADGLERLPLLAGLLAQASSPPLTALQRTWPELVELAAVLRHTLVDDPPLSLSDGGLIHDSVDARLDGLRNQLDDQDTWLEQQEALERRASGNPNLRLQYHRTFGYFLSVSRAKAASVPTHWIRRQTLANEERFVTPELKGREGRILQLRTRAAQREYELFCALREQVGERAAVIREAARRVAELDVIASLAEVAATGGYCRPEIVEGRELWIDAGRHPVVEQLLVEEPFTANSLRLGSAPHAATVPDLLVLTGPNASGKSCYLRQSGLLQLMAQIGSWIPARSARLGIADRIFTRVGAVDDLASGQSTFMVEMAETANILHHATSHSLVLLDEIGRGTATFDGLSIAWAVAEHLAERIGARTIFATHYHELNELADLLPNVANAQVLVQETGDDLVFLHQVVTGGASRSYGIEAARLAGVPPVVVQRARQVLDRIEANSHVAVGLEPEA
ncbi:DNA mismatch repair protein MutS [Synechococcus sp. CBW1006]|uniref:DNA mismatch repair protein MutS n=1 Tax=Synechococcus sp. CBW1006 TaxID=1353138 RepID=UPI0018CF82EC|nr:DNA mismatch repair protein MutS [Synechococcus sp. CBW1006]QPN67324.1 DNA mismatch repair protein MutS [Synechococcus sp. CBW1006]